MTQPPADSSTLSHRQREILHLARAQGAVQVEPLAMHFGVTSQTIRRDLIQLAWLGFVGPPAWAALGISAVYGIAVFRWV